MDSCDLPNNLLYYTTFLSFVSLLIYRWEPFDHLLY